MKKYRLVDNDELIATPEDLQSLIRTVDSLPTPSASNHGVGLFLRTSCKVGDRFYLRGYVYKCVSHYETDPETGVKILVYTWEVATYSEAGALDKISNWGESDSSSIGFTEYGHSLWWTDPEDKKYSDTINNATWACTIIVRKVVPPGANPDDYMPKSVEDGEIVGMSGVRNQYNDSNHAFIDHCPVGNTYKYNIFAVTKYGVATGLEAGDGQELTWPVVQDIIRRGKGGSIFSIGDCVTIEHSLFGAIDIQVVHMGKIPIRTSDNKIAARYGVVFMSRQCLPRCTYDAKEKRVHGTVKNPADNISAIDREYYASNRGRADWKTSNLRQFLNSNTSFYLSEDRKWNMDKFYFVMEGGNYIQLPIPIWPDRVDPKALGYYEAAYVFNPQHDWDQNAGDLEQKCVYGRRELPGFYQFLPVDFRSVLADVIVPTTGSNLTNEPDTPRLVQGYKATGTGDIATVFLNGQVAEDKLSPVTNSTVLSTNYQYVKKTGDAYTLINRSAVVRNGTCFYYLPTETLYPVVLTEDKIFIPSRKELFGVNNPMFTGDEGQYWSYFNPAVEVPDLGEARSHLKYDVEGKLSGYYTRTLGLIEISGGVYTLKGDSTLWSVKSKGFVEPPPLGARVIDITSCSMSKASATTKDKNGIFTAPGIAWCCVVAYTGEEA